MSRNDDAILHLSWARQAQENGDFLAARMEYMKCVESWKQAADMNELEKASIEYQAFVARDPIFKELLSLLLPFIERNPGILQSDIVKQAETAGWAGLYNYDRPLAKEDIYYALYFADKFGQITRTKRGRSYELRVGDQENAET